MYSFFGCGFSRRCHRLFGGLQYDFRRWRIGVGAKITLATPVVAQAPAQFSKAVTKELRLSYLKYLPKGYDSDPSKSWPLVVFLHGSGERGTNLSLVAVHGPPKLVLEGRDFPFILISPHCPASQIWDDNSVLGMMDDVIAHHRVDTNRVYLTGLSPSSSVAEVVLLRINGLR